LSDATVEPSQATGAEVVYKIPESRMWEFKSKVTDLARKAEKLGLPAITFKVVDVKSEKRGRVGEDGHMENFNVVINYVEVHGTAPTLNGWKLVGTLIHTGEGNFALPVAGFVLPEQYRTGGPECDHCQVNRYRKDTFIVRGESGEHKQVGSSCLKDFLGNKDPQAIARFCEHMILFHKVAEEFDADWRSDRHSGLDAVRFEEFTISLARVVRQNGFVSGKEAFEHGKESTGKKVWYEMTEPTDKDDHRERARRTATDDDKKTGKDIFEWAVATYAEKEPASDFEHNLRMTVRLGLVVERTANIAAAIYTLSQKAEREKLEEKWAGVVSEHVGEIGKRGDFVLTCVGVFQHPGQYGITNITRFRDEKGNVLVWFQSGTKEYKGWGRGAELKAKKALEEGKTYRVRATPKAFEERNGQKQTILTRATVEGEVGA
jgi:hypothetical protein